MHFENDCRYFFAEVFDFFRNFFLMVFNMNIIFMVLPLAIRLKHRPCFLAFVYTAIVAILKSYPSVSFLIILYDISNKLFLHVQNIAIAICFVCVLYFYFESVGMCLIVIFPEGWRFSPVSWSSGLICQRISR